MRINVHGGHSLKCRGASGYLDEVNEDRKVKNRVIELLRANGHTVYDCTDDNGATQNANLRAIVNKCNSHSVDLDVSIHLNAGGGTGTEVYIYNSKSKAKDEATRIAEKVSNALGIRNRGVKTSTKLYVLRKTNSPALLVECCFVDNATDRAHWNADKCAKAIVEGILTKNAKDHDYDKDGCLNYGTRVTVSRFDGDWAKIPSGWVARKYLKKV